MVSKIPLFIFLVFLSAAGVFLIRLYAQKRQMIDHPNARSSHFTPTPRGGGLAIVMIVLGVALWRSSGSGVGFEFILLAAVIAWLGWRDDIKPLSPRIRFFVQGLVAAVSIFRMGYFKVVAIPLAGDLELGWIGILITFFWIVGLTNAYNFMDGIDGMAGGVGVSGALGWMMLAANMENDLVYWISFSIAASSLGFLFHNWPPAKIFMGDVSSTFLGYTFAVLPLLSADDGGDALMLGTLLMWTFIMDTGLTFLRRAWQREPLFSAHRTHLFQRLVAGGYSHSLVSALFILLTLLAGLLSLAWSDGQAFAPPSIILGLPVIWVLLSRHAAALPNDK